MTILGLHHITLVTTDAQRNVDFYTGVLGLRLVKKTINFDDPSAYHLYYGNETGAPGSAVTFFEWPHTRQGHPGIGGTHHYALQVTDYDGLLRWKRRLTDLGLAVDGPREDHSFAAITFRDPDGTTLEIATQGPAFSGDEEHIKGATWPEPVPDITPGMALSHGMHHITAISSDLERTHAFYGELLGMQRVKMTGDSDNPDLAHWYWGVENGRPGTLISYYEHNPASEPRVRMGAGQTHHFALAVADEEAQLEWREKLVRAGLRVTPVLDRVYFKSIYTNDPDGHIVELATLGPGFMVDEEVANLGMALKLPPWLEQHREAIEGSVKPVTAPAWAGYAISAK